MKHLKNIALFLAIVVSTIARISVQAQNRVKEIIIISTNDVHGRIDNFGKMAAYVKTLKKTNPDVFVFNAGDLINGNPVVDEAKDKGYPIIDLMNSISYNVSCLGNHEFENGEEVLQRRITQSSSVFVDANVYANAASALKPLKPYCYLPTSDGTKIAVLGLTASSSNPCLIPNITVTDPVKKALEYRSLRDSCNILMALTHIGYKQDSIMAIRMKELDVIIGGHSHTELPNGVMVNGVLITQAGDKLRYIGKTVLKVQDHHILSKTFTMVDLSKLSSTDKMVEARINTYNHSLQFGKIAGYSTTKFKDKQELGCLKADAIANVLKLDIAFDHSRNVAYESFPKGKITIGDIYEIDSYDYKIIKYNLTAKQIRAIILNSMKKSSTPVLFVSGLTYAVKTDSSGNATAVELKNNGKPLDEDKLYTVGMNSFISCHFMPGSASGTTINTTSAEALIKYLKKHSIVNYAGVKRVFVNN